MNCRGASRRLSAYIDNNLSPGIKQGVEEHLQHCVVCKRRLTEFQAIVAAAQQLTPLAVSSGFEDRVIEAVRSRQETHEILSGLRYRLTLAGVAFMVTSAAIFFIVGPPSSSVVNSFSGRPDSSTLNSAQAFDFYAHPEAKIKSFPVPEGGDQGKFAGQENLVPADSIRRGNFNVMPNLQRVNENIR
jgi:anti-sigma factor RsiW